MSAPLLLHERTRPDGTLEKTWLEVEEGSLFLHIEGAPKAEVPLAVLDVVMRRYGRPVADDVPLAGPRLEIAARSLSILRYRPRYDVIARDYFVYAIERQPPLAELATAVTAALAYLVHRGGPADDG